MYYTAITARSWEKEKKRSKEGMQKVQCMWYWSIEGRLHETECRYVYLFYKPDSRLSPKLVFIIIVPLHHSTNGMSRDIQKIYILKDSVFLFFSFFMHFLHQIKKMMMMRCRLKEEKLQHSCIVISHIAEYKKKRDKDSIDRRTRRGYRQT